MGCALEIGVQSSRQETVPGTGFSPIIRPLALLVPGLLPYVPSAFSLKILAIINLLGSGSRSGTEIAVPLGKGVS
jgi:hypothetical protein